MWKEHINSWAYCTDVILFGMNVGVWRLLWKQVNLLLVLRWHQFANWRPLILNTGSKLKSHSLKCAVQYVDVVHKCTYMHRYVLIMFLCVINIAAFWVTWNDWAVFYAFAICSRRIESLGSVITFIFLCLQIVNLSGVLPWLIWYMRSTSVKALPQGTLRFETDDGCLHF